MNEAALFAIIVVAFYDLFLIGAEKRTISQSVQTLFPRTVDMALLVVLSVVVSFLPLFHIQLVGLGVVLGHLFWAQMETWRRP